MAGVPPSVKAECSEVTQSTQKNSSNLILCVLCATFASSAFSSLDTLDSRLRGNDAGWRFGFFFAACSKALAVGAGSAGLARVHAAAVRGFEGGWSATACERRVRRGYAEDAEEFIKSYSLRSLRDLCVLCVLLSRHPGFPPARE